MHPGSRFGGQGLAVQGQLLRQSAEVRSTGRCHARKVERYGLMSIDAGAPFRITNGDNPINDKANRTYLELLGRECGAKSYRIIPASC